MHTIRYMKLQIVYRYIETLKLRLIYTDVVTKVQRCADALVYYTGTQIQTVIHRYMDSPEHIDKYVRMFLSHLVIV